MRRKAARVGLREGGVSQGLQGLQGVGAGSRHAPPPPAARPRVPLKWLFPVLAFTTGAYMPQSLRLCKHTHITSHPFQIKGNETRCQDTNYKGIRQETVRERKLKSEECTACTFFTYSLYSCSGDRGQLKLLQGARRGRLAPGSGAASLARSHTNHESGLPLASLTRRPLTSRAPLLRPTRAPRWRHLRRRRGLIRH